MYMCTCVCTCRCVVYVLVYFCVKEDFTNMISRNTYLDDSDWLTIGVSHTPFTFQCGMYAP